MFSPAPDLLITPSLRLVSPLGQGGMGSVWVAEHLTLHSHVVVKFMAHEIAHNPEAIARFSREAAVAARARSPHVVQIFDHGITEEQVPYIVMELLEGMDLGRHLDVVWRMEAGEVSTLVSQVATALTRAHKLGVIHRDIKPENVFLTEVDNSDLFVKLLDFGIARTNIEVLPRVTRTGVVVGTPQYMSPECLLHPDAVSAAGDLWALAAVAYEALTGRRPFEGDTIAAITLSMYRSERPRPSLLVAGIPKELDEWFERAFALDPRGRFPDARAMAEAFTAAQKESAIRRSTLPPPPRRVVALQRHDVRSFNSERPALSLVDRDAPTIDGNAVVGAIAVSAPPRAMIAEERSVAGVANDAVPAPPEATIINDRTSPRRWLAVAAAAVAISLFAFVAIRARSVTASNSAVSPSSTVAAAPTPSTSATTATKSVIAVPIAPMPSIASIAPSAPIAPKTSAKPSGTTVAKGNNAPNPPLAASGSVAPPQAPKNFDDVQ